MITIAALSALFACRAPRSLPDPENELPFGFIDIPRDRQLVGRMVKVGGWALDDSSVSVVRIYVDGRYKASTPIELPRPDVSRAFPTYVKAGPGADIHGWQVSVDVGENAGPHAILAQAVDARGATRDLGNLTVTLVCRD